MSTRTKWVVGLLLAAMTSGACNADTGVVVDDPDFGDAAVGDASTSTTRDRPPVGGDAPSTDMDAGDAGVGADGATGADGTATADGTAGADGAATGDGSGVYVPTREVCDDGLDNNVDGRVDEGCACIPDTTQGCFAGTPTHAGRGPCARGVQRCEGVGEFGTWGACTGSGMPALETCDQMDNDCDGEVDE